MASWYLGYNRGTLDSNDGNLTVGTSSGSTDYEVRIDTGKGSTKKDVIVFLKSVARFLESNGIPDGGTPGTDMPNI
jgi:hypothetical protein